MDELNRDLVAGAGEGSTEPGLPQAGPPRPLLHVIFIGPNGLRAGWRLLIYAALCVVCYFALARLVLALFPRHKGFQPLALLASETVLFLVVLLPAMVMARFEQRSLADYGLPVRCAFGKHFWVGVAWGIAAISVLIFGMYGAHAFSFGGVVLHGVKLLKWAVFWAVFFVVVGLFEEFSLRGYTLYTLSTGITFWPAALITSIGFGAIHLGNPGEAWVGGVSAGLIGLFLCLTVRRTGSLWWAIGFHQSFDWGETFLYSVPNSGMAAPGHLLNSTFHGPRWLTGGTVGPEGSVLVFVVIALLFVVFDRLYREAKYPVVIRAAQAE